MCAKVIKPWQASVPREVRELHAKEIEWNLLLLPAGRKGNTVKQIQQAGLVYEERQWNGAHTLEEYEKAFNHKIGEWILQRHQEVPKLPAAERELDERVDAAVRALMQLTTHLRNRRISVEQWRQKVHDLEVQLHAVINPAAAAAAAAQPRVYASPLHHQPAPRAAPQGQPQRADIKTLQAQQRHMVFQQHKAARQQNAYHRHHIQQQQTQQQQQQQAQQQQAQQQQKAAAAAAAAKQQVQQKQQQQQQLKQQQAQQAQQAQARGHRPTVSVAGQGIPSRAVPADSASPPSLFQSLVAKANNLGNDEQGQIKHTLKRVVENVYGNPMSALLSSSEPSTLDSMTVGPDGEIVVRSHASSAAAGAAPAAKRARVSQSAQARVAPKAPPQHNGRGTAGTGGTGKEEEEVSVGSYLRDILDKPVEPNQTAKTRLDAVRAQLQSLDALPISTTLSSFDDCWEMFVTCRSTVYPWVPPLTISLPINYPTASARFLFDHPAYSADEAMAKVEFLFRAETCRAQGTASLSAQCQLWCRSVEQVFGTAASSPE